MSAALRITGELCDSVRYLTEIGFTERGEAESLRIRAGFDLERVEWIEGLPVGVGTLSLFDPVSNEIERYAVDLETPRSVWRKLEDG